MSFTRQHYEAIAEVLRNNEDKESIVHELIFLFKRDNARFDEIKFLEAIKSY
jgi:hypothetical protein